MSQLHHSNSDDAWLTDILAHLPADLEQTAREYAAFTRVRAFATPCHLLRGLLAYAYTADSLRSLGAWGVLMEVADLAPASWLERLRRAGPWLQALVAQQLNQSRPRWLNQLVRGRVLLVDATCLDWYGGTGNQQRLHLAYDVLQGQMVQLISTDGHTAEHVRHFQIRPTDLFVLDGGYGYRDRVAHVQAHHADIIVRIYPPTFPLEHADGRALDVRGWLDRQRADQCSRIAYYRYNGERRAVRVLAARLSKVRRQAAQRRAKNRARKRMRALSEVTAYYADWMLLVSTLLDEQSWPDAAVWRLYAARWQIELVFKALKQFLALGKLRCRMLSSAEALVWARILVWLIHEPLVGQIRHVLRGLAQPNPSSYPQTWREHGAVVSEWSCHALILDTLMQALRGTWTLARLEACLPRLTRFLVTHPRKDREHQASEVRAWLSGQHLM